MKITIITPLWRPENLAWVAQSIPQGFRWIVVFGYSIPRKGLPENGEYYAIATNGGLEKRNLGIDIVKDGHICFLDDDTILHPDFSNLLNMSADYDFIHFNQIFPNGKKRIGGVVKRNHIDVGNFVVSRQIVGDIRMIRGPWQNADGRFAEKCFSRAKKPIYLNKNLSIYNALKK